MADVSSIRCPHCGTTTRVPLAKLELNVDENPQTANRFDVRSIPTLLVMVGGREVDRIIGAQPKDAIRARLERAITSANS